MQYLNKETVQNNSYQFLRSNKYTETKLLYKHNENNLVET